MRRRMNSRSRSARRRLRDVQRRAAGDAHHLVLDVGQRRPAAPARAASTSTARPGRAARITRRVEQRQSRARRSTPASAARCMSGRDPAVLVEQERLRVAGQRPTPRRSRPTRRAGSGRSARSSSTNSSASSVLSRVLMPSTVAAGRRHRLLRPLQQRQLLRARLAPRRPEVHQHDLAPVVVDRAASPSSPSTGSARLGAGGRLPLERGARASSSRPAERPRRRAARRAARRPRSRPSARPAG